MDKTAHAVLVFDKRASDYQQRFMDVGLYHDTLDALLSWLVPNAKVLELACGPGNVSRYLLDRRDDLKLTGTDLSPNMIALAKANNPRATFYVMDMRAVGEINEKFDAIVCGFGLPYLSREEAVAFIANLAKVTNSAALVYLSTMEGAYGNSGPQKSSDGKDEIFIHLHQADYLTDAFINAGFEMVCSKLQPYPERPGVTDLILTARRKANP